MLALQIKEKLASRMKNGTVKSIKKKPFDFKCSTSHIIAVEPSNEEFMVEVQHIDEEMIMKVEDIYEEKMDVEDTNVEDIKPITIEPDESFKVKSETRLKNIVNDIMILKKYQKKGVIINGWTL